MPGVDDQTAGFLSLEVVAPAGWSGAGYNIAASEPANTAMWNDDTHFHMAYCTPNGNGPSSIAITVGDKRPSNTQAKFAGGPAFDDNGTVIPSAGPACTDEWQAVDMTFAELKKDLAQLPVSGRSQLDGQHHGLRSAVSPARPLPSTPYTSTTIRDGGAVNSVAADVT